MSIILVNTLTGTSTAGSIAVTGEGNSTTTNLQQGLAKHMCNFNMSTASVADSFNNSSLTDSATGQFVANLTNNMGNANYYPFMNSNHYSTNNTGWLSAGARVAGLGATTTSTYRVLAYGSGAYTDAQYNTSSALGDLA